MASSNPFGSSEMGMIGSFDVDLDPMDATMPLPMIRPPADIELDQPALDQIDLNHARQAGWQPGDPLEATR